MKKKVKQRKFHIDKRAHKIIEQEGSGNPDDLLDTHQVAAWLSVSTQWLEIGRSRGYGPPFQRVSERVIRYRRDEILKWLSGRQYNSTSEYRQQQDARARA